MDDGLPKCLQRRWRKAAIFSKRDLKSIQNFEQVFSYTPYHKRFSFSKILFYFPTTPSLFIVFICGFPTTA